VEDLINEIQNKTGLPGDKVLEVVTMVADYLKNALPEELVNQVATYLSDAAASPGESASGAVGSAADIAAKTAGTTASALNSVVGAVTDLIPTQNQE
jgi:hypothetical protein